MFTNEEQSFHMALDVKGALTNWKMNDFRGMFKTDDGRTMSPREAKQALLDALSDGHLFIPIGDCDNFDPKKGCLGHPVRMVA